MKPDDFIGLVIKAHEDGTKDTIDLGYDLQLEPKPNFSGKMAREAFLYGMQYLNIGRKYAGLLDFKISFRKKTVLHKPDIILPAVTDLPIDAIRYMHQGLDPIEIDNLTDDQIALLCCIQATFAEQEINWGEEIFQQRTYFGRNDMEQQILKQSTPRDYQMVYIERCAAEVSKSGKKSKEDVDDIAKLVKTAKSGQNVRLPIIKKKPKRKSIIEPEFNPFLPTVICGKPIKKWIEPHIPRVLKIVDERNENPFYREP